MKRIRRAAAFAAALLLLFTGAAAEGTEPAAPAAQAQAAGGNLRKGSKGDEVTRLQERLQELGYLDSKPDGVFGNDTVSAVKAFQRRNGLSADGQAGPLTQERLYAEDAVAAPEVVLTDTLEGELPMLVNKKHMVEEYFQPADLVLLTEVLDSKLCKVKYKDTQLVREAAEALEKMLEAAKEDGVKKWQVSAGYRTWEEQNGMLNTKIESYLKKHKDWSRRNARNAALKTVAEPGASEHHLGLAVDINVPGTSAFKGTKQQKWLHKHCWEYGFIIRYTADKEKITGFAAEEWHIRYVGTEHAQKIKELGLCLEEYIEWMESGYIQSDETEITEIVLDEKETAGEQAS